MTELKDLLFDVEMIDNPVKTNNEYSKMIVANIDGEKNHLNYCSPRFMLLKNIDVFPVIENMLIDANCGFIKAYSMNDDKTAFHAQYIIKEKNGINLGVDVGGKGDKIYPTALIDNSYNGMSQGSLTFGFFRLICSNGLVIPLEGKEETNYQIKGKHTQRLSFSFGMLVNKIDLFLNQQSRMKEKFEVLTDRIVPTYEERVLEVLVANDISTSVEQFKAIANTIRNESNQLGTKVNDFLIYNGINSHIFKGIDKNGNKSKAQPEVKRKLDKKVFSYMMAN